MVDLQNNFEDFHEKIRLDVDDNSLLKKYKDEAIDRLKNEIEVDYSFDTFLQGSYSVFTGIKSSKEDIDFDIDVAVAFEINREDYPDPRTPKSWVKDALEKIFPDSNIEWKNPCVTVNFTSNKTGKNVHVDVAIYAKEIDYVGDNYYLARGKESSGKDDRCWEKADPKKLKEKINNHFKNEEDRGQFRRVIRYLKRWKDMNFKQTYKPTGIGLTINMMDYLDIKKKHDSLTTNYTFNDLEALKSVVEKMIVSFNPIFDEDSLEWNERLEAKLPVEPYNDTYSKMTSRQMTDFKGKLESLYEDLKFAVETIDEHEATKRLNKHFGEDFEVVSEEEVYEQNVRNSVATDSPSA
jgi:hypothetical protein